MSNQNEDFRDVFSDDPRAASTPTTTPKFRDVFAEIGPEPSRESIFDIDIPKSITQTGKALASTMLQMPIGGPEIFKGIQEAGGATGLGVANFFLTDIGMKAPYSIYKGIANLLGGEKLVKEPSYVPGPVGRAAIERATEMYSISYDPKTETGKQMTETIAKGIEIITKPGKIVKDVVTKLGFENLGYLLGLGWELWTFKALHAAPGVARTRLVKRSIRKSSPEDMGRMASVVEGAGRPDLAVEIKRIRDIKDSNLRRKAINKIRDKDLKFVAEASREALREGVRNTPIEDLDIVKDVLRQSARPEVAEIIDYTELVKRDVGELGMEAFPEAKVTPLLKPKKPSIKEGQEHFRRTQDMTRRLNTMVKKANDSGVVLSDKNKIDVRRVREEIKRDAEEIREEIPQKEALSIRNETKRKLEREFPNSNVVEEFNAHINMVMGSKYKLNEFEAVKEALEMVRDLENWQQMFSNPERWSNMVIRAPEVEKAKLRVIEGGLKDARTLRVDERQVPPRRRDVIEEGKREGREDIQRIEEERRGEAPEEALEDLARKEFGEGAMPYGEFKLSWKEAEAKVAEIGERYIEIRDGEPHLRSGVDARAAIGELDPFLSDIYVGDLKYNEAVGIAGNFMEIIRREGNLQRPNNVMRHPIEYKANTGSEIVLNDNLEAFKSPFEAADYARKNDIEGRAWKDPDLGWVIERGGRVAAEIQAHKEFKWQKGKEFYYELLKRILKSQKGAIEIERLSTKQKESIRRFAMRSTKAGMDMEKYLIKQGIDPQGAKDLKAAAMALDSARTITEPYVTDFETGPIVSTKAKGKMRGMLLGKSDVYAGERNALFKGDDLISRTSLAREFRNPIRNFMEAGADIKRMFYDRYIDIENVIMKKRKAFLKESKSKRKLLSHKEAKDLGLYAIAQEEGGLARLKNSKHAKAKIPEKLSEKQQRVYDWMRDWFDRWFEEANEMKESIGKKPMKREEAYFTFMQALTLGERLGLRTNFVLDSAGTIRDRMTQWSDTPFRYAKRRVKGKAVEELKYTLEIDPFYVVENYGMNVIDHIEMSPLVAKIAATRRALKQEGTKRRIMLRNEKPNLDSFLLDWSNHLARRELIKRPRLDRALRSLNKNLAFAILSLNARTAAIQPSALRNTNALTGTRNLWYGLVEKSFTRSGWKEAFNKSRVLDLRLYNISIEQAMGATIGKRLGRAKQIGAQAGMWPMKIMDIHAAVASWHAGLRMAEKMVKEGSLHKSEIYRYADDVVIRTQASGLRGDLAPIQRTALGKALSLFQTFVINDWNFFHEEVLGIKSPRVTSRMAMRRMIRYVAGTMLINTLMEDVLEIKSPFPRPIKMLLRGLEDDDSLTEASITVFKELLEPIPIMSSLRYGSTPLGATAGYIGEVGEILSRDPFKKEWYDLAARALGVPGTAQTFKALRGAKRDAEVWEMIFGSVERPSGGRGGGLRGLKGLKGLKSF